MPYGTFSFLYHDAESLVFIAGGIGITPFISMLRYIYDRRLEKRVMLIWSNKTEKDIVFRDELEKMASDMPCFKVVHVMSRQDEWPGEKGRIDAEKLEKHVGSFHIGQFFICGPPPMMRAMKRTLSDLGVPKGRIHTERFALR
jgi:ferredoxin-NADP reductase